MEATERLGRYRLLRLVATGGMGEVFLARQEGPAGFAKTVVVKRILRHLASDASFVEMFLNEARVAALLSHPNIVQIFELGHEDDAYFIAMEYVPGHSVRSVCGRLQQMGAAWPPELAAWLCAQALQGLQHAHALRGEDGALVGVVHRDVSPENLLVSYEGNVKVADFGLAKAANLAVTGVGRLKGKMAYIAPEQLRGQRVTPQTDLYAMSVTLYEMLTGAQPYREPLGLADGERVLAEAPLPLRQRNARVPRELEELVLTGLAKDPVQRFASAAVMANALEGFIRREGLEASASKVAELLTQLYGEEAAPSAEGGRAEATRPLGEGSAIHTIIDRSRVLGPRPALARRAAPWVAGGVLAAAALGWAALRGGRSPPAGPPPAAPSLVVTPPPAATGSSSPPTNEPTGGTAAETELAEAPPPRAPQREAARTHPARPALGRVRVRVNPWADVLLDGQSLGTTPMSPKDVPAGLHVLTLKNRELGVERQIKVRVRPGVETLVKADLLE